MSSSKNICINKENSYSKIIILLGSRAKNDKMLIYFESVINREKKI